MKTMQEKIAVMQAFADGKEIEYYNEVYSKWKKATTPAWNWGANDYRVKEEPKEPEYIPFTFEDAEFLIGKVVKKNSGSLVLSIIGVQNSGIVVIHQMYKVVSYTWEELIREFKFFPDGSICGKLKTTIV